MSERPLLIFPSPTVVARAKLTGGSKGVVYPSAQRQAERLAPRFETLQAMFRPGGAALQAAPGAAAPEQVIVMETVGSVSDFVNAVRRVEGLEWLLETFVEDIEPDTDFHIEERPEKPLSGMLYLIGMNQRGLDELIALWNRYVNTPDAPFEWGLGRFRAVFEQLKDIRRWNYLDRLTETGVLENWEFRLEHMEESVRFEAELWFKETAARRRDALANFRGLVERQEGRVLTESVIEAIGYHGVLAELPRQSIGRIVQQMQAGEYPDVQMLHCEDVMFFRPVGQAVSYAGDEEYEGHPGPTGEKPMPEGDPVVGLLDGYPLQNHRLLRGRLRLDDPDGWGDSYPPEARFHGTAMASLIIHGDLEVQNAPALGRPLYVRPILRVRDDKAEIIPEDDLVVDLIHRAVRRLFEGDGGEPPTAPQVKVINLSVADSSRLFDRYPCPWARLLDWLSFKYGVLFLVSAGNHAQEICIDAAPAEVRALSQDEIAEKVLTALVGETRLRAIMTPSEAVNVLTVGASHADSSTFTAGSHTQLLIPDGPLPSPVSAHGLGFRRSVKPDVLMPGGRVLYNLSPVAQNGRATFKAIKSFRAPGQKVAAPGTAVGETDRVHYTRGTSNATALATRTCASIIDVIQSLQAERGDHPFEDRLVAVLVKALLTHGASWGEAESLLARVINSGSSYKDGVCRLLGYGCVDTARIFSCTDERATLVGCGILGEAEAHLYSIPLPPSLASQAVWRRLTLTLAWFSPINPAHASYRRASLWVDPPTQELIVERRQAHGKTTLRGTLQHEVLEGTTAAPFVDGDMLRVQVNCRADAGKLEEPVPYGLAVTLEVAPGVGIPIYDEIAVRIRPAVRVES